MSAEKTPVASNKLAIIHVLAALIQNPLLFSDNNYSFSINDFPEQFHRILFGAIEHLAKNGMEKIGYIDIDQFLKQYTVQYKVFCANRGVEYVQNAIEIYDPKKFDYYYNTLKKYSLLNALNAQGINTKDIYDPDIIDPVASAKMYERFDNLTVNDILLSIEARVIMTKEIFGSSSDRVENRAGDGLRDLKERFKQTPDMGLPLLSPKLTTIFRGQRRGCLFIESAPQGVGKALPNSSRLPTPAGWRTVGEIRPGDYLFDRHGKPTKVLEIFPQGPKEIYQVTFEDGRQVRCCEEHLWSFYNGRKPYRKKNLDERILQTASLRDIRDKIGLRLPNGGPPESPGKIYSILVPQQEAVEYPAREHAIAPYKFALSLTEEKDPEVPRSYLEDSIENRWDFLNGLLDGYGHFIPSFTSDVCIYPPNDQVADAFIELARSLGFSAKRISHKHFLKDLVALRGPIAMKRKLFRMPLNHQKIVKWCDEHEAQERPQTFLYNAMVDIQKLRGFEDMTCFVVDNPEHLFLTDDFVVTHNSRRGNAEACHLAVPEYFDVQQQRWIKTNLQENVLVISTELEEYECQQMWMAFVAGVSEAHIKDGRYAPGEEARVDHAIELLEKANLYFVSITNYDTDDIINIIKKYKQLHDTNYVFFDYLGETLKITSSVTKQTRIQGLRTDQILLMMSSALKDTAKTLGIYIWTASQLSGDYNSAKQLDATYLRSAKSIADKVDAGSILMPVREVDQPVIDSYCAKGFELAPNFVMSIYKVRAGSYQNIKLYIYFDRSTCQVSDCFVTDSRGNILPIEDTNVEVLLDGTREEKFAVAYGGSDGANEFGFDF